VLLGGAECMHSSRRARREPAIELDWYDPSTAAPTAAVLGDTRPGTNATEDSHGLSLPVTMYPLIESAIRAHSGRSIADHQVAVSEFWATFAAVSATNPHAWSRTAYSAETIRTAGPMNRMVTFPYPKLMMANLDVDQAAALILTNVETARSLGVPDEQLVYVVAGADGHDHFHVTERDRLDASPAIAATGRAALAAAGFGIDDVALLDLYSCFPAAPQIATQELGIARTDPRRLTVTGGLGFAGGPINNYVTHAIATMVEHCRRDPDALGLVHGLGWYVTKHSFGLYRATPSPDGYRAAPSPQPAVDALPRRRSIASFTGDATVEATAVPMNRDSTPLVGILSMLTDEGDRVLANTDDLDVARDLMETPWEGRRISLVADGPINRLA
jgi:acetyl-CoA C-acetyltransferase